MRKRPILLLSIAAAVVASGGGALAVSDGTYDPNRQHCSGYADSSSHPDRVEQGCHSSTVVLADASHEYVVVGTQQTADHQRVNSLDVCIDLGSGTKRCAVLDPTGVHPQPDQPGTPANPASGLSVYFGADDNLDNGEHDSSDQVHNGPSDGGALAVNVRPETVGQWVASVLAGDRGQILTHPLPLADAGTGACADGICISVQTQERTAFQGGDKHKQRDAADYSGKQWDPESCGGPNDTKADCGGHKLDYYNKREGTVHTQPGIQVYEDPDAQGSPAGPSYPIPAFYVGTCGLIVGGGSVNGEPVRAPASPWTNSAGQLVIPTGC